MTTATAPAPTSALDWARRHLFRTRLDGLLTVVIAAGSGYVLFRFLRFVFVTGRWEIIQANLKLLMVGNWPVVHLPRISVTLVVMALWSGVIAGLIHARQVRRGTASTLVGTGRVADLTRRFGLIVASVLLLLGLTTSSGPWITAAAAVVAAVAGRLVGAPLGRVRWARPALLAGMALMASVPFALYFYLVDAVPFGDWEGFWFNVTSAIAGIILSFPLGVLLALGRRSTLPLLRMMATTYIELVRGSPLFVLLLLANVALEFFVPPSLAPSKPVRAVAVFAIFTSAYLAEIVRGGLQSVPRGQVEAARSLGLSPVAQLSRIVLPQALRNVIPAQIGQFISLFKDTTLAGLALGILDELEVAQAITRQPAYRGQELIIETLTFTAFLFWVGSYTMSRESQRLERRLGVGER